MTTVETFTPLPDHTQLPCEDGTFVFAERAGCQNFQEHPQSILLTESIIPVLDQLHPDGQYCIGQDSGIYWRMVQPPEPPQRGAEAPDWFYVANVPPTLEGEARRSYVLWQEIIPPRIVIEFVSGTGAEERDQTPWTGKFWVYETAIRPAYYAIYEVKKAQVEIYQLVSTRYQLMQPNAQGRFPIKELGVELGIWQGRYQNLELPWLRWWDTEGNVLPSGPEQAALAQENAQRERENAERERQNAERERRKNEQLAAKLRELGVDPESLG
ncbi:MAG: Uma2 family endonuclease [Spirulinaceae cyanobacterium]